MISNKFGLKLEIVFSYKTIKLCQKSWLPDIFIDYFNPKIELIRDDFNSGIGPVLLVQPDGRLNAVSFRFGRVQLPVSGERCSDLRSVFLNSYIRATGNKLGRLVKNATF
jgi:hypothetical protein